MTFYGDHNIGGINLAYVLNPPISRNSVVGSTKQWSRVEMNALAPLLEAFEETIAEKDELISNYKKEMELFTNRCKDVISENDALNAQLVEANKKVIDIRDVTISSVKKCENSFKLDFCSYNIIYCKHIQTQVIRFIYIYIIVSGPIVDYVSKFMLHLQICMKVNTVLLSDSSRKVDLDQS